MKKIYDFVKGGIVVFLKGYGIAVGMVAATATFAFAAVSYDAEDHFLAISATGLLAASILVAQTMNRDLFRPRDLKSWVAQTMDSDLFRPRNWKSCTNRKRFRTAVNTLFVGMAIHYSALIIGVSFGAVFSAESGSNGGIVAVLIQQAVLTRAAWVLVNEYRRSSAR